MKIIAYDIKILCLIGFDKIILKKRYTYSNNSLHLRDLTIYLQNFLF